MVESLFERFYPVASRLAAVRAVTIAARYGLPTDFRDDLQQEILLELWRKRCAHDPLRGSWRTFAERVVANRMASLVRRMYSERSGQFKEDPLENFRHLAAPDDQGDLRVDVSLVLSHLSSFDREVALHLMSCSASETSQALSVSRATVYRAINRLKTAFTKAGLSPRRPKHGCNTERSGTYE